MRRASIPAVLVLLFALSGCIQVTVPPPAPSEPVVETPIAPVDEGPSDGDIEACEGVDAAIDDLTATDRDSALAAMNTIARDFARREGLADDSNIKLALGLAATTAAQAVDETRASGHLTSSTAIEVQRTFDGAVSACEGIA